VSNQRYDLKINPDSGWSVIDLHEERAAEMHGAVLNRLPHDAAEDLIVILNAEERRKIKGID
jgi:hypothetical protein